MYKPGSIISIKVSIVNDIDNSITVVHTIGVVHHVEGDNLYVKHAICSVDGNEYLPVKTLYPGYEGEVKDSVTLCNGEEFDLIIDTEIIPRGILKNL